MIVGRHVGLFTFLRHIVEKKNRRMCWFSARALVCFLRNCGVVHASSSFVYNGKFWRLHQDLLLEIFQQYHIRDITTTFAVLLHTRVSAAQTAECQVNDAALMPPSHGLQNNPHKKHTTYARSPRFHSQISPHMCLFTYTIQPVTIALPSVSH